MQKTPDLTTATACKRALTGVGATIAAGNHLWSGMSPAFAATLRLSASVSVCALTSSFNPPSESLVIGKVALVHVIKTKFCVCRTCKLAKKKKSQWNIKRSCQKAKRYTRCHNRNRKSKRQPLVARKNHNKSKVCKAWIMPTGKKLVRLSLLLLDCFQKHEKSWCTTSKNFW